MPDFGMGIEGRTVSSAPPGRIGMWVNRDHGFRFAPPVATCLGPSGAKMFTAPHSCYKAIPQQATLARATIAARGKREDSGSEMQFLAAKTIGETPVPQFCHGRIARLSYNSPITPACRLSNRISTSRCPARMTAAHQA